MWLLILVVGCNPRDDKPEVTEPTGPDTSTGPSPATCGAAAWSWDGDNAVDAADASFVGEVEGDGAGGTLLAPGDLDGDGAGDLVVGAPFDAEAGEGAGKVYLVTGAGARTVGQPLADRPSFLGAVAGHGLATVRALGDTDGDGRVDLSLHGGYQGADPTGQVYLVRGRAEGWTPSMSLSGADATAVDALGLEGGLQTGWGPAADFDGDGRPDWPLLQPQGYNGELRVVSGTSAAGEVTTPAEAVVWMYGAGDPVDFTGWSDLDGDGRAEVVADAADGSAVFVLFASDGLVYEDAVSARATTSVWGVSGELLGDLDGDGAPELVVARTDGEADGVGLFFDLGPDRPGLSLADADLHLAPGELVQVAWVGDVDGDGRGDLGVRHDPSGGDDVGTSVSLYLGRDTWPSTLTLAEADVRLLVADGTGYRLPTPEQVGDLDGDGRDDLVLVAPGTTVDGVEGAGVVAVLHGRATWDAEVDLGAADARLVGTTAGQRLGDRLVVADLDADGCDDVATSSLVLPAASPAGETFVFFGQPRE